MNSVTYTLVCSPENAGKIKAINDIILSEGKAETKVEPKKPEASSDNEKTLEHKDVVEVAKKAKKDHGAEFIGEVLDGMKVKESRHLGRRITAMDESLYGEFVAKMEKGPTKKEEDGLDDGLGDDTPKVSAEAVKTALKAFAKKESREAAKAIMSEHGVEALSKVDNCDAKALAEIFKKVS